MILHLIIHKKISCMLKLIFQWFEYSLYNIYFIFKLLYEGKRVARKKQTDNDFYWQPCFADIVPNEGDNPRLLADHLEKQFKLHQTPADVSEDVVNHHRLVNATVQEYLQSPTIPFERDDFISSAEVARVVRRLLGKKTPGNDGITNATLKQMPRKGLVSLARLFNGILHTQRFPAEWKTGKVFIKYL